MTTSTGAQDAVKIDALGHVGIGTANPDPSVLLDVNGAARVSTLTFPSLVGEKITLYGTGDTRYGIDVQPWLLQIHTDTVSADTAFGHFDNNVFTETMRIKGDGTLHVGGASSTLMVVTSSGVAIGAQKPEYALDVPTGNARFNGLLVGNNDLIGQSKNAFLRFDMFGNVVLNAAAAGDLYLGYDQGQNINFGIGGQKVQITSDGKLWVSGDLMLKLDDPGTAFFKIVHKYEYYVEDYLQPSDLRLKRDVQPIHSALDTLRQIRGVRYRWNDEGLQYLTRDIETTVSAGPEATPEENQAARQAERDKQYKRLSNTEIGVVAQDVETALPEAVITDDAGYKKVRHDHLIPLLIEAVKELSSTVQGQSRLLAQQHEEIARLSAAYQIIQQQAGESR